ncbi:MAG: ATP-binding protein [Sneathiella sp.]
MFREDEKTKFASVSRRLIIYIVLTSTVITLVLTAVQLYRDYKMDLEGIDTQFKQIEKVHLNNIAETVWTADPERLQIILEGLANLADIVHVSVVENGTALVSVGTDNIANTILHKFPLVHNYRGKNVNIGHLYVKADLNAVYQRLYDRALIILVSNAIKTFLVVCAMVFIVHYTIIKQLKEITDFVKSQKLRGQYAPLKLTRLGFSGHSNDELSILVDAINLMQTELRAGLEAKDTSERNLRTLINTLPDLVWLKDTNGVYVACNHKFERLRGAKQSEIVGKTDYDFSDVEQADFYSENDREVIAAGGLHRHEAEVVYADDGHSELIEKIKTPMYSRDGELVGVLGVGRDITESKQLEKQVRHAQKMEAVGQLVGGISHDFNNILAIVLGNLEILERKINKSDAAYDRILKAKKGAKRGADIARKLLGFSRTDVEEVSILSINSFVENIEDLIAKSLTVSITVETELAKDLWNVAIDPGDFEDALLNLSINARDAMPDGGTLYIETANKKLDEEYVRRNPEGRAGDFVMISVSDTGIGMTEETREKVLDPFFTTKEQGKGTGLGLSMVYGFVNRSGGHLKIYSEIGKGTTFRLYLPRATKMILLQHAEELLDWQLPTGSETVLVVDDEEGLREVAVVFLEELGYTTLVAENGLQALEILRDGQNIDLLFSDVVMPGGTDGYQVAKMIHEEQPSLKVLLTSGFTKKKEELRNGDDHYLMKLNNSMLGKPYNKAELALAIRAVFSEGE